jgi:hypothetical protein
MKKRNKLFMVLKWDDSQRTEKGVDITGKLWDCDQAPLYSEEVANKIARMFGGQISDALTDTDNFDIDEDDNE